MCTRIMLKVFFRLFWLQVKQPLILKSGMSVCWHASGYVAYLCLNEGKIWGKSIHSFQGENRNNLGDWVKICLALENVAYVVVICKRSRRICVVVVGAVRRHTSLLLLLLYPLCSSSSSSCRHDLWDSRKSPLRKVLLVLLLFFLTSNTLFYYHRGV